MATTFTLSRDIGRVVSAQKRCACRPPRPRLAASCGSSGSKLAGFPSTVTDRVSPTTTPSSRTGLNSEAERSPRFTTPSPRVWPPPVAGRTSAMRIARPGAATPASVRVSWTCCPTEPGSGRQ